MMVRVVAPAAVALAMAGVIAFEATGDVGADEAELPATARVAGIPAVPQPARPDDEAAVQDILARPLFTPNRQPSTRAKAGGPSAAEAFHRRLTGVAIGPSTREALFAGEGHQKPIVVPEGEAIEGWTVDSIETGSVTLHAGAKSQVVEIIKHEAPASANADTRSGSPSTGVPTTRRDR